MCGMKSCFNFCRMMCIIVYDRNPCNFSFILETAVCSCETSKSLDDHFFGKTKKMTEGNCCQCIGNIVDARHFQIIAANLNAIAQNGEGSMSIFVISDICCLIICIMFQTISDHITWKIPNDIFIFRSICIDDQCTVSRKKLCKAAEGMTDIVNILKEIQMVCIHIQDNTDLREKAQKAVCVFAGFCDKSLRIAYADVSADSRKNTSHTDSRVTVSCKKNVRYHRCCGCFSMSSGNGNRSIIIPHDLPEKLCTCEHWKSFFLCTGKFRVVRMDSCGIYHNIYVIGNVCGTLSVIDGGSLFLQCLGKRTGFGIGTGNDKILAEKNLGQSAHADAADTDKMYMKWFVKIYLIHSMFSLINYLQIFINPVTVTYSHSYWNCFICLFIILPVP